MSILSARARLLSPLAWAVAGIVAILLLVAVWTLLTAHARNARQLAADGAGTALAASHAASAHDAVETTVQAAVRDAKTDHITQENRDAIHAAPGADAPVDPVLSRAGIDGLCKYKSYAGSPQCLRHADPVQPSQAGSSGGPSSPAGHCRGLDCVR